MLLYYDSTLFTETMLARMFDPDNRRILQTDKNGEYLLDRNGRAFERFVYDAMNQQGNRRGNREDVKGREGNEGRGKGGKGGGRGREEKRGR